MQQARVRLTRLRHSDGLQLKGLETVSLLGQIHPDVRDQFKRGWEGPGGRTHAFLVRAGAKLAATDQVNKIDRKWLTAARDVRVDDTVWERDEI